MTPDERLAVDEAIIGARKEKVTVGHAFKGFWSHPSPYLISTTLVATLVWRLAAGDWRWTDLWAPVILVAIFPVLEWVIHVFILHWRPRKLAGVLVDSQLARDHRRHHSNPRDVPLVFIPWQSLIFVILGYNAIALLVSPRLGQALTFMLSVAIVLSIYEWSHYLIHSDYKPKTKLYKAIWRNHRLHHYKNEHYWFSVTSSGTSDRLFGTYPDPAAVATSPTAKNLHGVS